MDYYMPFHELFWREKGPRDEAFSWDAKIKAKDLTPKGVKGFIVELSTTWTFGENNLSGMNRTLLANNSSPSDAETDRHDTPTFGRTA